jgi:hypothetical protein
MQTEPTMDKKTQNVIKMMRKELKTLNKQNRVMRSAFQDSTNCIKRIVDYVKERSPNLGIVVAKISRVFRPDHLQSAQNISKRKEDEFLAQKKLYKKLLKDAKNLHEHSTRIMQESNRNSARSLAAQNVSLQSKILMLENEILKLKNKI